MTGVPVQIIWHKLARNVCFGWRSPPIDATLYLIVFIIISGGEVGIDSGHPWPAPCGRPAAVPIRSRRIGRTWRLRTYTLFQKKGPLMEPRCFWRCSESWANHALLILWPFSVFLGRFAPVRSATLAPRTGTQHSCPPNDPNYWLNPPPGLLFWMHRQIM